MKRGNDFITVVDFFFTIKRYDKIVKNRQLVEQSKIFNEGAMILSAKSLYHILKSLPQPFSNELRTIYYEKKLLSCLLQARKDSQGYSKGYQLSIVEPLQQLAKLKDQQSYL